MRLIDADRLKRQVEGRSWRAKGKIVELIDNSPTIRVGENICKHRTPDGLCRLHTDDEVTWYCVDGPCLNEEPITEDEPSGVKHGRWEWHNEDGWYYSCSVCGHNAYGNTDNIVSGLWGYCPNCGAKMDAEEGEEA